MNSIINALTAAHSINESKAGARKNKTSSFKEFFEKTINSPRLSASEHKTDKKPRIHTQNKWAVKECKGEAVKQPENADVALSPILENNTGESGKTDENEMNSTSAEMNHEIVRALSLMLLIPPENIMQAIIDLNIKPYMLQEQAIMDELLLQLQAVVPVASETEIIPDNHAALTQSQLPFISEPFDDALNEQVIIPPEDFETRKAVKPYNAPVMDTEQLSAAVTHIVNRIIRSEPAAPPETEMLETFDNGSALTEISSAEIEIINPEDYNTEDFDTGEESEETIGESWYYSDTGKHYSFNEEMQKSEFNNQPVMDLSENPVDTNINTEDINTAARSEAENNTNLNEVISQVTEGINTSLGNGITQLRLTLKPESLGEVTLKLLSDNGIINARFTAENQRVKEIMESNFNSLRDSLSSQGISINQLSVSVDHKETPERRFIFNGRRGPGRIKIMDGTEESMPPLAVHDSRVSYTA